MSAAATAGPEHTGARSRRRAWLELLATYAAIEAVLWTVGWTRFALTFVAAGLALWFTFRNPHGLRDLGIGKEGFRRSLWIPAVGGVLAALILLAGFLAGTLHLPINQNWALHLWMYAGWVLAQQYLLQSFFFQRLETALGRNGFKAVIAAAFLFASAHLPNPILLFATFIGGLAMIELFRRYRNIYTLAIAHFVVSLALGLAVPNWVHHQMRVGIGYLQYKPKPPRLFQRH